MDDSQFFSIQLDSYGETACSPDMSEQLDPGIRIAAPQQIDLSRHQAFPLCGTLRLQASMLASLKSAAVEATAVVVIHVDSNTPHSFNLNPGKEPLDGAEASPGPGPAELDEEDYRENYFNVDLRTFSDTLGRHLPPGRYVVYAVLLGFKSNTVEVEVIGTTRGRP